MKKNIVLLSFIFISYFTVGQVRYPYNLNLQTTTMPEGIIIPNESDKLMFTDDGVLLTNNKNQLGGFVLDGVGFNSANGLDIEIEYLMYANKNGTIEQGISFFLYDGSKTPSLGVGGAGLGYSFSRTSKTQGIGGVDGGYLGIGIDVAGQFRLAEGTSQNGLRNDASGNSLTNFSDTQQVKNNITLRGAVNSQSTLGYGDRISGYPVLVSISTANQLDNRILDDDGYHKVYDYKYSGPAISLKSTEVNNPKDVVDGEVGYRKVYLRLIPHLDGGYNVTLKLQHESTITTIIENYHYKEQFKYSENSHDDDGESTLDFLDATVPETLKFGFAASTSRGYQKQLIKGITMDIPYSPETKEDTVSYCYHSGIAINPFNNDIVYKGDFTNSQNSPIGGNGETYIDFSSFRFENEFGNTIAWGFPLQYIQIGVGTWTYNQDKGEVIFSPARDFAGEASIYYSVKGFGNPFGQESYRSRSTKITFLGVGCGGGGISNPHLPASRPNLNDH